jgi:hypothetical protein
MIALSTNCAPPPPASSPCNGGRPLAAAHVVVQVQAAQVPRVDHQLVQRRAAVHRAADVLEGDAFQALLQGGQASGQSKANK